MRFILRIREKFIEDIKNGIKTKEFRLNDEERKQIKVNDVLTLKSKSSENYVNVVVKKIETEKNWIDVIDKYYESIFSNLFKTKEEAYKECLKFYPREKVEKYGIIVFDIECEKVSYSNVDCLIDTNIFIKRESSNNATNETMHLYNWFRELNIEVYLHELTKEEIQNHIKRDVVNNLLTKTESYQILRKSNFTTKSKDFDEVINKYNTKDNHEIDNQMLFEVFSGHVSLLITDDNLMHEKARKLYISDRVKRTNECLEIFETEHPDLINYQVLSIEKKRFSEINLNDKFFDTLKEDYNFGSNNNFEKWFENKSKHNECAYVFEDNGNVKGFLYLKTEEEHEKYSNIDPQFSSKKRLKIGTFKIAEDKTGFRLSERFIKIIFDNAMLRKVDEIFVTMYQNKRPGVKNLINKLESWGFYIWGNKTDSGEIVMVKDMKNYHQNKNPRFNFPLLKMNKSYYFLPIKAEYHSKLFPDMRLNKEKTMMYNEEMSYAYALEKIYITRVGNFSAQPGDIVLIYRMGEDESRSRHYSSTVTGVAVIQEIKVTNNYEEFCKECSNKSVFKQDDLQVLFKKNFHSIIKLLDYKTFTKKVILKELREMKIIGYNEGPRILQQIQYDEFKNICEKGETKIYE